MISNIRNFCIIAHIDHGKSTLADRLMEITETVSKREAKELLLDSMDLEREKGITIKLQPVKMSYKEYELNLIDTPGHADFGYEVSRSLAAVEGALLVVDATQGIQAQTLATLYQAIDLGLEIIPVLNKVDLPAADIPKVSSEIINLLGCDKEAIIPVSAKTGENVKTVLDEIVSKLKPPVSDSNILKALIFDSYYDEYKGVVLYLKIVNGVLKKNANILFMQNQTKAIANHVGYLSPVMNETDQLVDGQIGYCITNLKSLEQARVGDTLTLFSEPTETALPGYSQAKAYVYAGIYPSDATEYDLLKSSIAKLKLNDAALNYTHESSTLLGFGFRVGFLGLLHLDIIKERLLREYNLEVIITSPSVDYKVLDTQGNETIVNRAADLPDPSKIEQILEPIVNGEILTPKEYLGSILEILHNLRGKQSNISYVDDKSDTALVSFSAPLANILTDFYDNLKSVSSGYASFSYEIKDYKASDLVKVDIVIAGEIIDSLAMILHRSESIRIGRKIVGSLKDLIPRQQFKISLQASIGSNVIAREDLSALRKDVTAKLYGGDVSRKKKLLEKQKKGKKRMKQIGNVDIPNEVFKVLIQ